MLPAVAITSLTFGLVLYLVLTNAQERVAVRAAQLLLARLDSPRWAPVPCGR